MYCGDMSEAGLPDAARVGRVSLVVADLAASIGFYREIVGMALLAEAPASASLGTPDGTVLLELAEQAGVKRLRDRSRLGLYHFGLKVGDSDDELREAYARLVAAGVDIVGSSDHTVTHSLYILDPDGNELELYIAVPGVDWKSDPALVMAPIRPLVL